MGATVNKLQDGNIVHVQFTPPFKPETDGNIALTAGDPYYAPEGDTFYIVLDFSEMELGFSEAMMGTAKGTAKRDGFYTGAPNSVTILVGTDEMVKQIADWVKQDQYAGEGVIAHYTTSVNEALAFIKKGVDAS